MPAGNNDNSSHRLAAHLFLHVASDFCMMWPRKAMEFGLGAFYGRLLRAFLFLAKCLTMAKKECNGFYIFSADASIQ